VEQPKKISRVQLQSMQIVWYLAWPNGPSERNKPWDRALPLFDLEPDWLSWIIQTKELASQKLKKTSAQVLV
jgi:hypothetical protein